eukprot:CAMPEP_0179004228 /NCGR_PEP_ID=MMETSP0795-20121207/13170_1 /TAXON_ID=88552 /ORGANISM="Amoebophrya sp., Strain Ameob2" /LENGTH=130 /DNA_ID=CAMNT_0020698431 /DNA_START=30 /DNA_END=422 /DNA_ORIENTATION=-
MCPAVLDYHEKYHIGFFDRATRAAQHPDLEAATVLIDGANCIKSCFCPPSWNKHSKSRPAPSSAPLPRNIDRHHDNSGPPANRSEEEIAEVFRQTQEETQRRGRLDLRLRAIWDSTEIQDPDDRSRVRVQ